MHVFEAQNHVDVFVLQCSHGVLVFCCVNSFLVCELLMQGKNTVAPLEFL